MRAAMGPAMNATKAMGPVAAVAKARSATAPRMSSRRVALTRMPRPAAESSPSWRAPSERPCDSISGTMTTAAIAIGSTRSHDALLRLPVNHCIAVWMSQFAALDSMYEMMLCSIAATPIPIRMSRVPAKPPLIESR